MTGPVWFSAMKSERGFENSLPFSFFTESHRCEFALMELTAVGFSIHSQRHSKDYKFFGLPCQQPQKAQYLQFRFFAIFFPLAASISVLYSEMMLIWLKAIKTDNKTGKDLALIVTMCCSWELWPLVQQQCLLMSLYSTLIFSRKQGQEMCIGLGMLEYILCTRCWTNRSRNPAAGWICFGPGLTNPGPSKTQTNFLVDNKQFLSQQAAQLWEDGLWMLFKHSAGCVKDKSTHRLSQYYSCRQDVRTWTATI